MEHHTLGDLMR